MFPFSWTGRLTKKRSRTAFRPHRMEVLEDRRVLSAMADVVFLVDGSGSGGQSAMKNWLKDYVFASTAGGQHPISQALAAKGITDVRYGLIAYGDSNVSASSGFARSYMIDPSRADALFGNAEMLDAALENFALSGNGEDAWDAIEHLIAEYRFRPGAVAAAIVVQNAEGRNKQNSTLTRHGILAALESKNVLVNYLGYGSNTAGVFTTMFDLVPYGGDPDVRILGVESDTADGAPDGQHDYVGFNTSTGAVSASAGATHSDTLQISYNGSNTGASGMVASGKSVLISKSIPDGIGPTASGYRAKEVPFEMRNMSFGTSVTIDFNSGLVQHAFNFYGVAFPRLWVNIDGTITFADPSAPNGTTNIDPGGNNVDLSNAVAAGNGPARPTIAALWDDFFTSTRQARLQNVDNEPGSPNNDLVIQWSSRFIGDNNPFDTLTFQAVLLSNGDIRFNFGDLDSYPGFTGGDFPDPDGDTTVFKTGGINATVGIWKGGADPEDSIDLQAGKLVPGPHSISGSVIDAESSEAETNDAYIRLAWDTGGAAWDLGVIDGIDLSGTDVELARTRLRDAFVSSFAAQINEAVAVGRVAPSDDIVLAIDFGVISGPGADGFTADYTTPRLAPSPVPTIDISSNSIPVVPTTGNKVNGVFQNARLGTIVGSTTRGNLDLTLGSANGVVDGTYIIELFFAEIGAITAPGQNAFDVVIEGKTLLNDYDIFADRGRVVAGLNEFVLDVATIGSPNSSVMPAGVVKRFLVDVSSANGAVGLQIHLEGGKGNPFLNGLRILKADPPRVENVVLKGSTWRNGVEYSYADAVAAGNQLRPTYYQGVNRIEVHFDGPVNIPAGALSIRANNGTFVTGISSAPTLDASRRVATWSLSTPLVADKYAIVISGVTGAGNTPLDGDWMNLGSPMNQMPITWDDFDDDPTGRTFLSGNGTAAVGEKFEFFFSVLPGDYDQNGVIDSSDLAVIKDGDGDGVIESGPTGDDRLIPMAAINTPTRYDNYLVASRSFGDYYDNEIVEIPDYGIWKGDYGNEPNHPNPAKRNMRSDGNIDNRVDSGDYLVWRNNLVVYSAWYTEPLPPSGGSGGGGLPTVQFGEAPRVSNVTVSGSMSTHPAYSFDEHDGSGEQLRTVPVGLADTISISFTEDVNITANMLSLVGLRTANRPTLAEFSYDLGTMTASWRFEGWALADQYAISLSDAVTDVEGNALDGEWTNPLSIFTTSTAVSVFPSGDGTAGGDFNFVATLLPGDANQDGLVNSVDMGIAFSNWNQWNMVFTDGDFNGDGIVNVQDAIIWNQNNGTNLHTLEILADLNGDWIVNQSDLTILSNNSYYNLPNPTQEDGDLDGDGDVDSADLDLMLAQWGLQLAVVA